MVYKIHNIEDWEFLAKKIIPLLKYNIILLKGNMGVGKTTFSQFLLKNLGSKDKISSPTYSIVNEYHTPKGQVFHFDLYRINDIEELFDIGIEEYLDSGILSIIEWPDIYEEELEGLDHHIINIENNNGTREVSFL